MASDRQTTRQMLDELDALMERMLALPVQDADDAPAGPRPGAKAPTVSASLTLLDPAALDAPRAPAPEPEEAPAPLPFPVAAEVLKPLPLLPAPARPEPVSDGVLPPSLLPRLAPLLADAPAAPAAAGWAWLPLELLNEGFDRAAARLGRPGRWLCRPGGRTLLGLGGVALLILAAVWLLHDGLGWPG